MNGSIAFKIMKIIVENDYLNCFKNIFIYTYSPDKYEFLKEKYQKIKAIFFDKNEIIDYMQEEENNRPLYRLVQLVTYDDYLYKYHILHEMISEQYGRYTEDCYNAAISVIENFLILVSKIRDPK